MLIGHRDSETNREQSLMDHLFNVANIGSKNAIFLGLENTLYLLGLYHDLGKADRNFQVKLKKQPNKKVNHSSAGAKFLLYYLSINPTLMSQIPEENQSLFYEFLEIIMYVITAHHGLYDIWSVQSNENFLQKRVQYSDTGKYHFEEDVLAFASDIETKLLKNKGIGFTELILSSFNEFILMDNILTTEVEEERAFYGNLKVRLLLAILKNADIEDTTNAYEAIIEPFDEEIISTKKEDYLKEIEARYLGFGKPNNEMNKIRNRLGEEGLRRGESDTSGIYQLNLPTGAGKTLISLRYGMQQLNKQNKDRFIYITPFLSVLEQNAKEIKDILKDPDIIEHHSNVIKETDNTLLEVDEESNMKEEAFSNYLIDTWDSPIVLSTMVQFFNSLFGGKSSNIRRFASLSNAVIVLDEVQSLPITVTYLFNLTMNFMSRVMKSTVIMCTATQPTYDADSIKHKIIYGGKYKEHSDIITLSQEERIIFERTEVHKLKNGEVVSTKEISDEVLKYPEESSLVILNTKHAVKEVFEAINSRTDRSTYYLSTNLCPKHRQKIIGKMKEELELGIPIICVSTQLIEAGVDIDFDRLIRSYAGIDSIIQAMGRCNRHGSKKEKGIVKLAKVSNELENISRLDEIKDKVKVTDQILSKELSSPINIVQLNDRFYELYYANYAAKMTYPISKKDWPSGLELLSLNHSIRPSNSNNKYLYSKLNQSFQTASKEIKLIKNETIGVLVYFKESKELIEELILLLNECENNYDFTLLPQINKYLQKLQPYTVNLYLHNNQGIMSYLDGKVNILSEDYYDDEMGVVDEIDGLIF